MTRTVTLLGYAAVAVTGVVLEIAARCSGRPSTFATALSVVLRRWPLRLAAQAGWLWLGWHLFVRVDWR